MQVNFTSRQRLFNFVDRSEGHAFTFHAVALDRGVVQTQDHILRRNDDRRAVCRRQNVVGGHHQNACFKLGFQRERHVNSHLVTVEVSVERRTYERVQLDRFTFDQRGFERLNAETVQRRRTVQHDGVFADHFVEDIPNFGTFFFNEFLRLFNSRRQTLCFETRVDERLEQLERHLLRQTTLVKLELWAGHNNRTTREVDALTQKVLTEATLLTFQHVRERLQRALVRTSDDAATATVVEQSVNGFLKHTLFVANDDVRRTKFDQALQTVVPVDHAAIQVVKVGGRKAATIQRNQRTQFWRDHRDHGEDHPFRTVARLEEVLNDFQTLDDLLGLQFASGFLQLFAQLLCSCFEVDHRQHFADRFGTDVRLESVHAVGVLCVEEFFLGHQLAVGQVGQTWLDHNVVFKVQNPFQITERHVEHEADPRRERFQEPDVCNRRGQFDVAHTLAAHFLEGNFNTTFFADNAAILHALIFTAKAFVVFDRAKDTSTEETVAFWFERAVVDGFWFLNLTERPRQDTLRRCERDFDLVECLSGRERVERVVGQFLVHRISLRISGKGRGEARTPHSSSSASRSSILRPRPRTSLTRTLNDSGTPASKLSSPLTIDS